MRKLNVPFVSFLPKLKVGALALAVGLALGSGNLLAADHHLTKVKFDPVRKVNVIDIVVSIDWDIDAPPAGRDKAFLDGIMRQASQSLFTMTEGKVMLGKVYIYKNGQFMDNTDMQYLLMDGRANAHVAGLTAGKWARIQQFAGTGETPADHGKTVAHELGHYALGIWDEYREAGGTSVSPSSPQDGDTPRNSIMNNHLQFTNITTPTDYDAVENRKTAQFRVYGKSAWEVMVQPTESDPEAVGGRRLAFEAFKGMTVPTTTTLTSPTTGWQSNLQIVYMGAAGPKAIGKKLAQSLPPDPSAAGPINTIVIDTTTSPYQLSEQIKAATQIVDSSGGSVRVAVYEHPFGAAPQVATTQLSSDASRTAVKAAIAKIAPDSSTDDEITSNRLFNWAETALPTFFPAGPATIAGGGLFYRLYSTGLAVGVTAGTLYYYDGKTVAALGPVANFIGNAKTSLTGTLQNALNDLVAKKKVADTPSVTVLSMATKTVDIAIIQAFKNACVAVNAVAINSPTTLGQKRLRATVAGQSSLFELSTATHGAFKEASKSGGLTRDAAKVANAAEGDEVQAINGTEITNLAKGASNSLSSTVSSGGIDGQTTFSVYWDQADEGKLLLTLKTPSGTVITPTSLPAGVTYIANAGEGEATYTVPAKFTGLAGVWTSTVTASMSITDYVYQEVATNSLLSVIVGVEGGTKDNPSPIRVEAKVSGPVAVGGATVTADIYSVTTGAVVRSGLVLLDNGVSPDIKANDGRYTRSLTDLPAGEYEIVVKAAATNAVYTTKGSTKQGPNGTDLPVPPFQRVGGTMFVKDR